MPIHEYYCPDNRTIYQFFARTLAQGQTIPRCPDNPEWRMEKMLSSFAVTGRAKKTSAAAPAAPGGDGGGGEPAVDDPRMEAAMDAMEREFARADENDPRAMARMMRRMAGLTGEKIDGPMEEIVRKLEEGADPESLEDDPGGADDAADGNADGGAGGGDADDGGADGGGASDGGAGGGGMDGGGASGGGAGGGIPGARGAPPGGAAGRQAGRFQGRFRLKSRRRPPVRRDPKLYDYDED